MNAVVKRIVELVFDDYEMSDEVSTIRDEVMANCQERFEDCVARGMSEDEAISAVCESLRGMEDVLKDYPKVSRKAEETKAEEDQTAQEDETKGHWCFSHFEDVRRLESDLFSEDLLVVPGTGRDWCVECEPKGTVDVECKNGVLTLRHRKQGASSSGANWNSVVDGIKNSWNDSSAFASAMNQFAAKIRDMGNAAMNIWSSCEVEVTVYVPEGACVELGLHSTSGDIEVKDILLEKVRCETLSGDISVNAENQYVSHAAFKTTSGDISVRLDAQRLEMNTVSGDLEMSGSYEEVPVSSVSGDVSLDGTARQMNAKSVSGDFNLIYRQVDACKLNVHTTSGDVNVQLPRMTRLHTKVSTVSGEVYNECASQGDGADMMLTAHTVSGDVYIQ